MGDDADDVEHQQGGYAGPVGPMPMPTPSPHELQFAETQRSFEEELCKSLCWQHLQQQLREEYQPRQAAAQLREYRRRHEQAASRDLQFTVVGLSSPRRAETLEYMLAAIRCLLQDGVPENDKLWLAGLAHAKLPPRERFLQTLQRAIYDGLLDTGGKEGSTMVAATAVELASNKFYIPSVRLLWPLVEDTQRLRIQQWLYRFQTDLEEAPASSSRD